mgnify:CR=1 FL=1
MKGKYRMQGYLISVLGKAQMFSADTFLWLRQAAKMCRSQMRIMFLKQPEK